MSAQVTGPPLVLHGKSLQASTSAEVHKQVHGFKHVLLAAERLSTALASSGQEDARVVQIMATLCQQT